MTGVRDIQKANKRLLLKIIAVVVGMFGFGFAMVPLYNVFCELTGVNVKLDYSTKRLPDQIYRVDKNRTLSLELVTSVNGKMPLQFRVATDRMLIHPGEFYSVTFYAKNTSGQKIVGQAIPSITPGVASKYLHKTECFCFTRQDFEPGQEKAMPVRFVIDPALPVDIEEMTLSYTFFDVTLM